MEVEGGGGGDIKECVGVIMYCVFTSGGWKEEDGCGDGDDRVGGGASCQVTEMQWYLNLSPVENRMDTTYGLPQQPTDMAVQCQSSPSSHLPPFISTKTSSRWCSASMAGLSVSM